MNTIYCYIGECFTENQTTRRFLIRDPSGVFFVCHSSSMTSQFPPFPVLNKLGFLRRFLFRIIAVAGRFVLLSNEEVNEFNNFRKT